MSDPCGSAQRLIARQLQDAPADDGPVGPKPVQWWNREPKRAKKAAM